MAHSRGRVAGAEVQRCAAAAVSLFKDKSGHCLWVGGEAAAPLLRLLLRMCQRSARARVQWTELK
eukprot:6682466-Pyramimonas_sp.AAC.1